MTDHGQQLLLLYNNLMMTSDLAMDAIPAGLNVGRRFSFYFKEIGETTPKKAHMLKQNSWLINYLGPGRIRQLPGLEPTVA